MRLRGRYLISNCELIINRPTILGEDHTPLQLELSISKSKMAVRVIFEPISATTGSSHDPINWIAPSKYIVRLVNKTYPVEMHWYDSLCSYMLLCYPNDARKSSHGLSQQVFAFDVDRLGRTRPKMKVYFNPNAKIMAELHVDEEHRPSYRQTLFRDALSSIGFAEPWSRIEEYLVQRAENGKQVFLDALSWDTCEPRKARMKIFIRSDCTSLEDLLSHITLGGTLANDKIHETELAAKEMWNAFKSHEQAVTVACGYELRRGQNEPVGVEFHFYLNDFGSSDEEIAQKLDSFLVGKMGKSPGWYKEMIEKFCSYRPLSSRTGVQLSVGSTVRHGNWDVTVHLSPEAYAPERRI
ncbi:hypothetical protein BT63DRAFT_417162 [Microthyrium microscopicum]|uniref:Aromatic prenyltransferase n=1 Tax=Microthyrium microscopicum TaxID=703497 RepID=A0A6A6U1V4_9PEZI|nr:hypothetical protein BT63DRAFT_417162 [Microthyrium microscopicum]